MAQDRPPAPQFPRDEVDPKTTIGSAQDQQPFVEYFARAPPESGTKGTWPKPEAFEAAPKPPAPPSSKREASVLFVGLACVDVERRQIPGGGHVLPRVEHAAVPRRQRVELRSSCTSVRRRGDVARDVSPTGLDGFNFYSR